MLRETKIQRGPNRAVWPGLRWGHLILIGLSLIYLAGCSTNPYAHRQSESAVSPHDHQQPVVDIALAQIDRPYRYGGHDPRGFDCSGLIFYAYQRSGIAIPRTTKDQHRNARHVRLREITPGDLLFFRESRRKPSHVGLYVGEGRFVHASTSEKSVVISQLDSPYWRSRLLTVGRYVD
jgi:cell wall-associated NlpC family hydrolase